MNLDLEMDLARQNSGDKIERSRERERGKWREKGKGWGKSGDKWIERERCRALSRFVQEMLSSLRGGGVYDEKVARNLF